MQEETPRTNRFCMKLVVPHTDGLLAADARLIRLAQFLGISCEPLLLDKQVQHHAEYIEKAVPNQACCFVVNPQVIRDWTGGFLPGDLVSCLGSRFPYLLVHGLTTDSFAEDMIAALSSGRLQSVNPVPDTAQPYEIAPNTREVCEAFSGLSFGPINSANDRVFSLGGTSAAIRTLISIGGRPFMALMKRVNTEILFLASENTADLNDEVGNAPLSEYFSRFVPHAMALRYIFGEQSWQPCEHHASIIIDDPLLRENYGFLNFESLLRLTKQRDFHTTIAFIPHNFRRNSPRITRMFRENTSRLAICFHGNDHTGAEFASTDMALLNTLLHVAEYRMNLHHKMTGLSCGRVMVFPQGNFSVEAMTLLKCHNFYAAVNTVSHPVQQPVRLTISELAQPAVLRYGGFPLFIRNPIRNTQSHDIAFNLFFGRPVLIVEHHDIFKHPETLAAMASTINSLAPEIHWSNLESAVTNSILRRRTLDGVFNIRAYSGAVRIANDRDSIQRFSVEWSHSGQCPPVKQVLQDGTPCSFEGDDFGIRLSVDLAPGISQTLSVVYRNDYARFGSLGFPWKTKAFLRRRLSEVRDNYVSKNQHLMTLAQTLQRRLLS
jgi:hypothetical protein